MQKRIFIFCTCARSNATCSFSAMPSVSRVNHSHACAVWGQSSSVEFNEVLYAALLPPCGNIVHLHKLSIENHNYSIFQDILNNAFKSK